MCGKCSEPFISTCALRSATAAWKFSLSATPARVLKKRVEDDGRRWQKGSLWSGRKVKRILWCGNSSISRSLTQDMSRDRVCTSRERDQFVLPFKVHTQSNTWPSSEEQKHSKKKSCWTRATATQSSVKDTFYNATTLPPDSHRHKEITDAVSYVIAKDMFPINTVIDPAFNKLIDTLDKRYVLPSRHHISRIGQPALYDECSEKVSAALYFASTADRWSSCTGIVFIFYFYTLFNSFYWCIFLFFICILVVFQVKLIVLKEIPEFKVQ